MGRGEQRLGFSLPFWFFGFVFWAFGIKIRIGPVSGFGWIFFSFFLFACLAFGLGVGWFCWGLLYFDLD
jgi:hypothetical protein